MASSRSDYRLAKGFRSGLEGRIAIELESVGITDCYETLKIPFVQPAKSRNYTPDFVLPNGIIIESKGIFSVADRQKHVWIKEQHPELDIRFVFYNSRNKIRKGSKTTYGMWCDANGFLFADHSIPDAWIEEKRSDKKNKKFNKSTA